MPLQEMAKHGHELTIGNNVAEFRRKMEGGPLGVEFTPVLHADMSQFDIAMGQRLNAHGALPIWRRMSATTRTVFEIDDDPFNIEPHNWNAYELYSRADVLDAVTHFAETAAAVTVTTEPLAEVMRKYNPNVHILPNHVPGFVLDLPAPEGERPAVGWAGGASHGKDIKVISRPLRQFLDRHPGWDAVLIGTDYRLEVKHMRCGFIPWVHVTHDPEAYYRTIDFDIGLAPLHPSEFARSKSFIKALEYAARGIPVIASDMEPYRDFVVHGETGWLARYDHEWLKYLTELANDDAMRAEMGAKAKEHARGYTIEQGWKLWEQVYGGLL